MADNLAVTPGSGAHVAADEASYSGETAKVQIVRLAEITGSEGGRSVNEFFSRRDIKRLAADSTGLTIATTAYSTNDQVGAEFSFANAVRVSGGTGVIIGAVLTSAADIIGGYDVVFTRSSITLAGDNAAWAVSDTDAKAIVAVVALPVAIDMGNNRVAQATGIAVPFDCAATTLYASLLCRGGHTFFAATTDLQLQVFVERH